MEPEIGMCGAASFLCISYLDNRPAGFELVRFFDADEGIFCLRSSVRLYEKKT